MDRSRFRPVRPDRSSAALRWLPGSAARLTSVGLLACVLALGAAGCREKPPKPVAPPSGDSAGGATEGAAEPSAAERLEAAKAALEARRPKEGSTAEFAMDEARLLVAAGDVSGAMRVLREAAGLHPRAYRLHMMSAELMSGLGQTAWALDELLAARAAGAPDDELAFALAVAFGRLGRTDESEREFDRAEKAGAAADALAYNRALIAKERGELAKAHELLRSAHALQPTVASYIREMARVELDLSASDPSMRVQAMEHVNRALDLNEEDWRSYELLGDIFRADGDLEAAKTSYVEAMRLGQSPPHLDDKYIDVESRLREQAKSGV